MFVQTSNEANYSLMKSIISRAQISKKTKDTSAPNRNCRCILQPKARAAGGEACLCFLHKQHKPEHTQKVNNEQEHSLIAVL